MLVEDNTAFSSLVGCVPCNSELVNGYKREAFQWIHYVGQPIRGRRAMVAVETGPDGTDCVDELLISLSFTKTERNFRSGSAESKQTVERRCTGRKEECVRVVLVKDLCTLYSGYTLELRLAADSPSYYL